MHGIGRPINLFERTTNCIILQTITHSPDDEKVYSLPPESPTAHSGTSTQHADFSCKTRQISKTGSTTSSLLQNSSKAQKRFIEDRTAILDLTHKTLSAPDGEFEVVGKSSDVTIHFSPIDISQQTTAFYPLESSNLVPVQIEASHASSRPSHEPIFLNSGLA